MRRIVFLLVAVAVVATLSGGAAAQSDARNQTDVQVEEPESLPCEEPVAVDRTLSMCSAELSGSTAYVVLESDRDQEVTVTDLASYMTSGLPLERSVTISEGRSRIALPAETYDGTAGIAVRTSRGGYEPAILERPTILIGGPWTAQDTQFAVLVTALNGAFVFVVGTVLYSRGLFSRSRRVA